MYKWRNEQEELKRRQRYDSSRNDSVIGEEEMKKLKLRDGYDIRDTYQIAYSYEDIGNILFGKWCLIANNLCILFYLFSCQCSYMTLIKVRWPYGNDYWDYHESWWYYNGQEV